MDEVRDGIRFLFGGHDDCGIVAIDWSCYSSD